MSIINIGHKAVNGYSLIQLNNVLRKNIIEVNIRKRWFCVFDKEYPYTVVYTYKTHSCKNEQLVFSMYPFAQINQIPYQIVTITKRYKTEKDITELVDLYKDVKTLDLE
jgi:hypothetical protein